MTFSRHISAALILLLALLLAVPPCEGAGKRKGYSPPVTEIGAEVLSVRRDELGTYLEVQRDDDLQEWIEIGREEGLEVKPGQRIAYTPRSNAHESQTFGRLRTGHDFRILPRLQREDNIYRGNGPDDSLIFTDNPRPDMNLEQATADGSPKKSRKKPTKKGAKAQEEEIVVDQDELLQQKARLEEYYRYYEQTSDERSVRTKKKAKKAKPKQALDLP